MTFDEFKLACEVLAACEQIPSGSITGITERISLEGALRRGAYVIQEYPNDYARWFDNQKFVILDILEKHRDRTNP